MYQKLKHIKAKIIKVLGKNMVYLYELRKKKFFLSMNSDTEATNEKTEELDFTKMKISARYHLPPIKT